MPPPCRIAAVRTHLFRAPIAVPLANSFGALRSRPMLLVEIEDNDGVRGWGEVWCNFPAVGPEHRARLIDSVLAPLLAGEPLDDPARMFDALSRRTHAQALQTGEFGPFAQCIAGLDQALCDLAARRAGKPLWQMLGGSSPRIAVYASGLGPEGVVEMALAKRAQGYRAFKLKVGFSRERDLANLRELRAALGPDATLMVDANQAWSLDAAVSMANLLAPITLRWLEEPIAADAPLDHWRKLAAASGVPLAAGENLRGFAAFGEAIESRALAFVQPDVGKWGGFSGCLALGRRARAAGLTFCPHWLGGGVGLTASMHLAAAVGGDGFAEVDANPNPLRERLPLPEVDNGSVTLGDAPGLGFVPDLAALAEFAAPVAA